ncbi:uncharacterized protein LOC133173647 isoform X2 [Saccostrea echinata]|uniref:uncharacterized protein LOC133173647 isoform X2 n=1 Tax=Saccostrea echinata TaxID=191078 RepID=UPI002A805163|nr:uncharacterized protein LOC133173647 isoform X2 [Saccostrea echinata]
MDQHGQTSEPEKPIEHIFKSPKLLEMKKGLPPNFTDVAKGQYLALLSDLKKLKNEHPNEFKMLEMNRKDKGERKEKINPSELLQDPAVHNIVKVLQMVAPLDEKHTELKNEWNELRYLLDARYFLKANSAKSPPVLSKSTTPRLNTDQHPEPDSKQQMGSIPSSSFTYGASPTTVSADVHDMVHTFPGVSDGQRQQIQDKTDPVKDAVKQDDQQCTSGQHLPIEDLQERPINQLFSRHKGNTDFNEDAQREYHGLLHKQTVLYKGTVVKRAWDKSSDFKDITEEQRKRSPKLFGYLEHAWRKMKDKCSDLLKEAVSEFIVLSSPSDQPKKPETPSTYTKKDDILCATTNEKLKHKQGSQSERIELRPIEKVFNNFKLKSKIQGDIEKAQGQFRFLVKRDDNFKRKFPDKHREIQVFMVNPDEYTFSPYQCLYNILRSMEKKDPLYEEAWAEYFYLVTSDQQFILAENFGEMFKSVYKKDIDSMVVPRKSYEELQNELVEKIKQIEELTTRLSKFASQQLTAGNPNIADLSDKHRPTKIGELYSELYDNEWSEVFEVIKALRHPNAEETESDYFEDVLNTLKDILMAKGESTHDKQKDMEYSRFITEHARKYSKDSAAYTVREASKVFQKERLHQIFKEKSDDPKVVAYVDKCIELTWYMRVQDPPMYLRCLQKGDPICKTEFAFHGRKGKTTSVCVWPALFLFEEGHLVTKGHVLPEP